MISKECFTIEWIDSLSAKYKYNDRILIEKVIRGFSLLELLVSNGCPITWKGGTSLMLILGGLSHRLSIDIDVSVLREPKSQNILTAAKGSVSRVSK